MVSQYVAVLKSNSCRSLSTFTTTVHHKICQHYYSKYYYHTLYLEVFFCPAIYPGKVISSWTPNRLMLQLEPIINLRNLPHLYLPHQIGVRHKWLQLARILLLPSQKSALPGKLAYLFHQSSLYSLS